VNNILEKADVDEAFELMLVITGIVCAIMSQYPEYFWWTQYPEDFPIALAATRSLILPLIVALTLWTVGKLVTNLRYQAVIKVFAWMYALNLTFGFVLMYMVGSKWLPFGPEIGAGLGNILFFLIIPSLNYVIVLPKYKKMYAESKFLQSKIMFIVASIVALLLFLITAGFIISLG
jgi:hypothetical protein